MLIKEDSLVVQASPLGSRNLLHIFVKQEVDAAAGAARGAGRAAEHVHGLQRLLRDPRPRPRKHDRRPLGESSNLYHFKVAR